MKIRVLTMLYLTQVLLVGCQQASGDRDAAPAGKSAPSESGGKPDGGKVELNLLDFAGIEQLVASHRGTGGGDGCLEHVVCAVHQGISSSRRAARKIRPAAPGLHFAEFRLRGNRHAASSKSPNVQKFLESQTGHVRQRAGDRRIRRAVSANFTWLRCRPFSSTTRTGQLRKRFDNENAQREADAFTYEQVGEFVAELLEEHAAADEDETAKRAEPDAAHRHEGCRTGGSHQCLVADQARGSGRRMAEHVVLEPHAAVSLGHGGKEHVQAAR